MSDDTKTVDTPTPAPQPVGLTKEDLMALLAENNKQVIDMFTKQIEALKPEPPAAPTEPEANPYQDALQARVEADLNGLTDDEKSLVVDLGGEDVLGQSKALTALRKAGKIGTAQTTSKAPESNSNASSTSGETPDKGKPETTTTEPATTEPPTRQPVTRLDLSGASTNDKPPTTMAEAAALTMRQVKAGRR